MRIEITPNGIRSPAADSRQFFSEVVCLPAGFYAARVQILFSEQAAGELIRIGARTASPPAQLADFELAAVPANTRLLDSLYLYFCVEAEQSVEIYGEAEQNSASTLLRFITLVAAEEGRFDPEAFNFPAIEPITIGELKTVLIGTTGICNASCLHCPTNKPSRGIVPTGVMDMGLFTKIITELAQGEFAGTMLVTLFNEPLADPFLEERLRLIKLLLPASPISIATNCALFDPGKHGFLLELADDIAIHFEGMSPEVYDRYMHPLKYDRVLPKVLSLLEMDKNNKASIVTPVHRGNFAETNSIHQFFQLERQRITAFFGIRNRSWEPGPWRDLSLAPVGGYCQPKQLRDFVIDWDGLVLACCNDFARRNRLGDLRKQTIADVLDGPEFNDMLDIFRTKRWSDRDACRACRVDHEGTVQELVEAAIGEADNKLHRFAPAAFRVSDGIMRNSQGDIVVEADREPGEVVIFGPYRRFPPGRYRVVHSVIVNDIPAAEAYFTQDSLLDYDEVIASRQVQIAAVGAVELTLDFELDRRGLLEFRLAPANIGFVYKGATVYTL
jgi:hypothetical protein